MKNRGKSAGRVKLPFKISSITNNIKGIIIVTGIVPVFIIAVFAGIYIPKYNYYRIENTSKQNLDKTASLVNYELTSIVRNSVNIVSNTNITRLLGREYRGTASQVELQSVIDMFLKYADSQSYMDVKIDYKIYTDNETIFRNAYIESFENFYDRELLEKILSIPGQEILWNHSSRYITFYRPIETRNYNSFLEVNIPYKRFDNIFENSAFPYGYMKFADAVYPPGADPVEKAHELSKEIDNGMSIYAYIPDSIRTRAYLSVFAVSFALFFIFVITVIFVATLITRTFRNRINEFITYMCSDERLRGGNVDIGSYDEFHTIKQRIVNLVNDVDKLHRDKVKMEIDLLQIRINPHLLYNSLSVLKWRAMEGNNASLANNIDLLSRYYRHVLKQGNDIITVYEEMQLIEEYIKIVSFAHSHKYMYKIEIGEEIMKAYTLKLLFQPIIENSLLHGINRTENAYLEITAFRQNENVVFVITDNGCGMTEERVNEINNMDYMSSYKSYGLKNTVRRIKLFYGDKYGITVKSRIGEGTEIYVTIPYKGTA